MTTIACNKEEMYGDLQYTTTSTGHKFKGAPKVWKFGPGMIYEQPFIVGLCGTCTDIISLIDFYTHPEIYKNPPKKLSCSGLVLTVDGDIFTFDDCTKWIAWNEPYAAQGSGGAYAQGALANGASPKEAVKVAMKHDAFTGMGVKGFNISQLKF